MTSYIRTDSNKQVFSNCNWLRGQSSMLTVIAYNVKKIHFPLNVGSFNIVSVAFFESTEALLKKGQHKTQPSGFRLLKSYPVLPMLSMTKTNFSESFFFRPLQMPDTNSLHRLHCFKWAMPLKSHKCRSSRKKISHYKNTIKKKSYLDMYSMH